MPPTPPLSLAVLRATRDFFSSSDLTSIRKTPYTSLSTHINDHLHLQLSPDDLKKALETVKTKVRRIREERETDAGIVARWEELEEERRGRKMTRQAAMEWKEAHVGECTAYNKVKGKTPSEADEVKVRIVEEWDEAKKRGVEAQEKRKSVKREEAQKVREDRKKNREKRKAEEAKEREDREKDARQRKRERTRKKVEQQAEEAVRLALAALEDEEKEKKRIDVHTRLEESTLRLVERLHAEMDEREKMKDNKSKGGDDDDDDKENVDVNVQ